MHRHNDTNPITQLSSIKLFHNTNSTKSFPVLRLLIMQAAFPSTAMKKYQLCTNGWPHQPTQIATKCKMATTTFTNLWEMCTDLQESIKISRIKNTVPHIFHPFTAWEMSYLDSILFVGDEVDARLHSGISTLSQYLFLQSIDICNKIKQVRLLLYCK